MVAASGCAIAHLVGYYPLLREINKPLSFIQILLLIHYGHAKQIGVNLHTAGL